MFDRICLCSPLVMDFWFWEFKITVSALVIGLFIFSVSSWFSLGRLCLSKNLSISSRLSVFLAYSFCVYVCVVIL